MKPRRPSATELYGPFPAPAGEPDYGDAVVWKAVVAYAVEKYHRARKGAA